MTDNSRDVAAVRLERAARIAETGPDLVPDNIQAMFGLYADEHKARGNRAPALARDLSYGPHPRHLLDVHSAGSASTEPGPVLLFVHGGGFTGGDKHIDGTPYYDTVGAWAVSHGMVGVTMTYRLAPEHQWPAGAQDVGAAAAWVAGHIGAYGGDPSKVIVAGHSAGATHVACYLAGQAGPPGSAAAGVLLSGIYDLALTDPGGIQAAYFGSDTSQYAERSPLDGLAESAIPVMFAVAEIDGLLFHQQAAAALQAYLRRDGKLPPLAWVTGHSHISEVAALGIDDEPLGIPLLRFIESVTSTVLPRPAGPQ